MSAILEINDSTYGQLLTKCLPRPIRSDAEHARATALLSDLDQLESPTAEEEALAEVLTLLIEDYEDKTWPLPDVPPHESLKALMAERNLQHKDIWPVLGNKGAATEILAGRRSISKAQARRLADARQTRVCRETQEDPVSPVRVDVEYL